MDSHQPRSGLVRDAAGNLYGIGNATVFQLAPNGWSSVPYASPMGIGSTYPFGELAANSSNAFGIAGQGDIQAGAKRQINHYSIHPGSGYAWIIADSAGNIYGFYSGGGPSNPGYIFELTH